MFVWNIDPNIFHLPDWLLGGRGIRYYGLLYVVTLMGGYYIWQWQMLRARRAQETAERFLMLGVIAVIGGARLGHCLFYEPEKYLSDPIRILYFWEGGLASHGSTIALIGMLIYFARSESMPIREVLDRFSMSAAWGAAIVRMGNFFNSEIVGRVSDQSVGVKFPRYEFYQNRVPMEACPTECAQTAVDACTIFAGKCVSLANVPWRHASQLYEFFMGFAVFGVLWAIDRKWGEERPMGLMGFTFLLLYFIGRFSVEFFKEFQSLGANEHVFTMGQYLSIPFIVLGAVGVYYSLKNRTLTPVYEPPAEPDAQ